MVLLAVGLILLAVWLILLRIRLVLLRIGLVLLGVGVLGLRRSLLSLFFLLFLRLRLRLFYLNGFVIDFHLIGWVGVGELLFLPLSGLHSGTSH